MPTGVGRAARRGSGWAWFGRLGLAGGRTGSAGVEGRGVGWTGTARGKDEAGNGGLPNQAADGAGNPERRGLRGSGRRDGDVEPAGSAGIRSGGVRNRGREQWDWGLGGRRRAAGAGARLRRERGAAFDRRGAVDSGRASGREVGVPSSGGQKVLSTWGECPVGRRGGCLHREDGGCRRPGRASGWKEGRVPRSGGQKVPSTRGECPVGRRGGCLDREDRGSFDPGAGETEPPIEGTEWCPHREGVGACTEKAARARAGHWTARGAGSVSSLGRRPLGWVGELRHGGGLWLASLIPGRAGGGVQLGSGGGGSGVFPGRGCGLEGQSRWRSG